MYPSIWTRLLLQKLHHLWLPLSLIFGMGTLKISYTRSFRGLLPRLLYLILCLSQHTLLQELEGSLQSPRYHRHIHRFVSVFSKLCWFFFKFFSALWRTRLNSVVDKPSPCLTSLSNKMWRSITIFTSPLQSTPSDPVSSRPNLILSFQLCLGFYIVSFLQVFQPKSCMYFSFLPSMPATCPSHPIPSSLSCSGKE